MVFTIILYGHGGHLGHATRTIWTNFRSPILRSIHMKFEFNWPSGFRGDVWKCWRTDAGVTGILIAHLGAFGSGELKSDMDIDTKKNCPGFANKHAGSLISTLCNFLIMKYILTCYKPNFNVLPSLSVAEQAGMSLWESWRWVSSWRGPYTCKGVNKP